MNGRLGSVKPREFVRKMKLAGFTVDHQTGSHTIMLNRRGIRIVVPMHAREMKRGLLMDLLKHAGLTSDEYRKL